jgi:ubiquinone/menaquinone biosynthesis C-methylase UbiE
MFLKNINFLIEKVYNKTFVFVFMEQREVWDSIAEPWEKFRSQGVVHIDDFLKGKTGKILDLGCGSGRNITKISGVSFYGVDFSSNMIELAKKKALEEGVDAEFKVAEVWDTGFEDSFFDYCIYSAVLHCVETREKRLESLKEVYRVLKSGGEAIISVWSRNDERVRNKPKDSFVPWTKDGVKYMRYYYIYDFSELKADIESVGFVVVDSFEDDNIVFRVRKE